MDSEPENSYQKLITNLKYPAPKARKRYSKKYRLEVSIIVMEEIVIVMSDMRYTAVMTMVIQPRLTSWERFRKSVEGQSSMLK
jgi:hypothetical protein